MNALRVSALGSVMLAVLITFPALAAGPLDGEVGAVWWANEFDSVGGPAELSNDSGAPGFRAELWFFERFGARAGYYTTDLDELGLESSDYTSIDLLWRPLSLAENSYLAVGLGWQELELQAVGLGGDTTGMRIGLEGRAGLGGMFYAYGQGSYMPELDDSPATNPLDGTFVDLSGYEFEAGLAWKAMPFFLLRAGYRIVDVDFTRTGYTPLPGEPAEMSGTAESSGFFLGSSVTF